MVAASQTFFDGPTPNVTLGQALQERIGRRFVGMWMCRHFAILAPQEIRQSGSAGLLLMAPAPRRAPAPAADATQRCCGWRVRESNSRRAGVSSRTSTGTARRALRNSAQGLELVELSGCCPPSPRSPTGAFSRLSSEFVLSGRTPRNRACRSPQILDFARASDRVRSLARVCDRKAERLGRPSATGD